jgi:hypothetical protein
MTTTPREEIRYWKKQFRVLKSWRFYFAPKSKYKGQCRYNVEKKTCTIYDLPEYGGKNGMPEDYIFHEVLHTAWRHVIMQKKYRAKRKAEEMVVQDVCKIMRDRNNFKKVKS